MRRYLLVAAVTAAAALTGSAAAGAAAPGVRAQPGARLWVARYDDGSGGYDAATAMAVSPDGATVFVTGDIWPAGPAGRDYGTVAYSAATGTQLWASWYSGPGSRTDIPWSVAVSPDGSMVFVTGQSTARPHSDDYATIAYDAATGRRLWLSLYHGPADASSDASALAVSPDGTAVFVTGQSAGRKANGDYVTLAYGAATGKRLWVRRYSGPGSGLGARSVAVSPGGGRVFVTGGDRDYMTIAYSAAAGRQLWIRRYDHPEPPSAASGNFAAAMAVSPDGTAVYVTGSSWGGRAAGTSYATVAYSAATGRRLWASRHDRGFAHAMAVSPDGTTVYVTGEHGYAAGYLTIAYSAATGRQIWSRRYSQGAAASVAVSPDGTTVYVTGSIGDAGYATVAYNATTGSQLWASRYRGRASLSNACCVTASPDGTAVYVTGTSYGGRNEEDYDYVTIAYQG